MGHRSKKKKKHAGAGGRRTSSSKDDNSFSAENAELIADELTALCAIFQEDCQIVPGSPRQLEIKLRPYSKDTGYENSDVSAILSVRFIPGYPNKCPKLQIVPEKGLSEIDTEKLLALLHNQANINSREGRVMIYNLVEAAQEFLSEIVPQISLQATNYGTEHSREAGTMLYRINYPSRGPFVYAYLNLFSGSGESWHWNLTMEQSTATSSLTHSDFLEDIKFGHQNIDKRTESELQPVAIEEAKQGFSNKPPFKLVTVEEETEDEIKSTEDEIKSTDSIKRLSYKSVGAGSTMEVKDTFAQNPLEDTDDDSLDSDPSESFSSKSLAHNQAFQTIKMELILVHLLRLACGPNGPLGDILPQITSELSDLGCVSEHVKDLAIKPSSTFNKTFSHVFGHHMITSKVPRFWATASDSAVSRYLNDFVELQPLGRGGYGHVMLCKNKLDGRQYAVKKIRLKEKSLRDRILREVTTLSRLQHQHVVRYYQAWFETGIVDHYGDASWGSRTAASSSLSFEDGSSSYLFGHEKELESEYLYIQMEYCPRTLRQLFEAYNHFDKESAWHLFRQIVEGLAHIHGQGIIHRDLTPNNIFFGARNDIKIGDFGLAKFLKREQLEQDIDASEAIGVSIDGTGQVGTYFYTAPEIEQGWPKIDEKADMYSLGVVFFELWHPFQTAMERHIILSDLKQKGELPSAWVAEFPEQASLLRRLMSPSPSDRPSANELLQHAFPPRMEYELLDNMLRTIHTSEDTIVYDKIVNSIFGDAMLTTKDRAYSAGRSKLDGDDTSSVPLTGVNSRNRDNLVEFATGVFRQHCAKHVDTIPMRMLGDYPQANRNSVIILTQGGDMVELCYELRVPFAKWVTTKQIFFFKRYDISYVYRRAIGHSTPNRYLQGDFDIVGGATPLTEAETIKVTMDIISSFFHSEFCDIHLNHGDLLEAIWSWTGIRAEHRQKVAELLSLMGSLRPQTPERKSKWVVIRRQLRQELNLPEASVNRLQTVGLRFCGQIDQALPRLRGALPDDRSTCKALDELSELFNYLRIWKIDRNVYIDPLMPPSENYHRNIFFQVYLSKNPGCLMEGTLLAIGGRYDYLLHSLEDFDHKSNLPGAVGTSLALETILLQHTYVDTKLYRYNIGIDVLVGSRGGGGLLKERMELVAELWEKNIKAEIVLTCDPSLKEQYEYANENDIKCLVIITDASVSDSVKVRHIEMKKEKSVERESLVKFLIDAMETQFKNPSIWN